ncbi:MAG TPA: hypothetical protein VGR28_04590 [Candidatus Thermoplasmatota archaeon]|jgi:hypothetical protein|nr:hypothetical protein [Candidatus Thermoplasmatota archaeon]
MAGFRPTTLTIHPEVQEDYDALEAAAKAGRDPGKAIWKSFQTCVARVRADGQYGEVVPCIARFRKKYDARNLYCLDLADWWRCFYTIVGRDVVFVDVVDHKQYDKWFPNKGK